MQNEPNIFYPIEISCVKKEISIALINAFQRALKENDGYKYSDFIVNYDHSNSNGMYQTIKGILVLEAV